MRDEAVLIDQVAVTCTPEWHELSAQVDGERVGFRFPVGTPLLPRPEPFLALGLQEAMVRGVPLRLATPHAISRTLLENLHEMQALFVAWNDEDLRHVPIEAQVHDDETGLDWVISAYSGGIDSSFTYAKQRDEITHLLLVQGFDGNFGDDIWQQNVAARARFASHEGKVLVTVSNNARDFIEARRLSWNLLHGSLLAALGLALRVKRMYVPSSFTFNDLFPWGSHPLLDPLWSNGSTQVVHHGMAFQRTAKTVAIAAHQGMLDHLQVCWRGVDQNCGQCPKCVRTSLALHLIGKSSAQLPPYLGPEQLRWLKPSNPPSLSFTEDLIQFALQHQRPDIAKALKSYRRHYLVRFHGSELVKVYGGKWARALARRWARKQWHKDRAKMQSARTWLE